MLGVRDVALVSLGYVALLFLVASLAERFRSRGRSLVDNPFVYTLSITVYCTAWTYYGGIGMASKSGLTFLAVYVGPTLMAFSWWMLIRRMIRITHENNIASIADFAAFRYGNSVGIGALVAVMLMVGITPYIGLQLKAVAQSFQIVTARAGSKAFSIDIALIVAAIMGLFGIFFSARQINSAERRDGMVAVVAFEGLIKLAGMLAVGIFVVFSVFEGPGDLISKLSLSKDYSHLLKFQDRGSDFNPSWFSLLILASFASVLLPRQFHMMVVEAPSDKHVRKAMYLFPFYLFLINLFVAPIAFAGLVLFNSPAAADSFILTLPLQKGAPLLALLAYVGGLAAATGMVIVSSVALSTMFLNNLCMPLIIRMKLGQANLASLITNLKRIAIMAICMAGYVYYKLVGEDLGLVNMGLLSFGASIQLAPAVFGGLFWRQATGRGAFASLSMGFAVWLYIFLTPALCQANVLPHEWLFQGPFGISLARPNALFGLEGLDIWSHGLFWTLLLNGGVFMLVSAMTRPSRLELEQVARQAYSTRGGRAGLPQVRLFAPHTPQEFEELLSKFISPQKSRRHIREFLGNSMDCDQPLSDREAIRLGRQVENLIGTIIGPAAASEVVERYMALKGSRMEEMLDVFGSMSISLEHSREELENRVRELSLLFEASKLVTGTLDEKKAIDDVLLMLENDFGLQYSAVFLMKDGKFKAARIKGLHPRLVERLEGEPVSNSLVKLAVDERKAVRGVSHEKEDFLELLPRFGLTELVAAPMIKENTVLGVVVAGTRGHDLDFTQSFVDTLEALAGEMALSITNARLFNEVNELNRTLEEKVKERTFELMEAMKNLKELDRMKSEFLANISHELRTPMNSIIGYTTLVLDGIDGPLVEEQRKSLERVENNARHLLDLINDLLDLSRIEAGGLKLELCPVDLGQAALDVCSDLDGQAAPKKVKLECRVMPSDLVITADETRVREILINLVGNAVKFTNSGSVSVVVSPWNNLGRSGVKVDVVDTGPGIPEAELGTIFQAFKQLDGSSTRKHGGAGLGLSIAKKLVEMHGGEISVKSSLGQGSSFSVWLPKAQENPKP